MTAGEVFTKEKLCNAYLWLKKKKHVGLGDAEGEDFVRELWFVLLEEDISASFFDTRGTTEIMAPLEQEEVKFTYQEDREDLCSIASITSLANYSSFQQNLIHKLSDIKTSASEEYKPKSLILMQRSVNKKISFVLRYS